MWRRIVALVRKEFITLLKEGRSRAVLIVPPLIQLLGVHLVHGDEEFSCLL